MDPAVRSQLRPEAMGDVPGVCALPLTRAVVRYRDVHELDADRSGLDDIGIGLVIEGRYAAAAEVLDLGSGRVKVLDLSRELVVLDWVYEPTHDHVLELVARSTEDGADAELRRYGFRLGVSILERLGFGPLTRPVLLQIGYRDVCRDLDLHDGTSIRILWGGGRVLRARLDSDACAMVFNTALHEPDPVLERALLELFGVEARIMRARPLGRTGGLQYSARFGVPDTLGETRALLQSVRQGLGDMLARFEPDRFATVRELVETFGARETLSTLSFAGRQVDPVGPPLTLRTEPVVFRHVAPVDVRTYDDAGFVSAALH